MSVLSLFLYISFQLKSRKFAEGRLVGGSRKNILMCELIELR